MTKTRLWLATIAALLGFLTVDAYDFSVNGVYYNRTSSSTVEVTYKGSSYSDYYNKYSGAITIPPGVTYGGCTYMVTGIGEYAFYECGSVTSIIISENVESIGMYAFYGCRALTSITIPEKVKSLGWWTFGYCTRLNSIIIPEGMTTIGYSAFSNCSSLTSTIIPSSVTNIANRAFYGCTGELVVNCNVPSSEEKSNGAFAESSFSKVTIGTGVTSIGDNAFWNCSNLTSIIIPESVTSIGNSAFAECSSLASVYINNIKAWCEINFSNQYANPLCYASNLYLNEELVSELYIPTTVSTVKEYAFYNCNSLTSVTIPESVTNFGSYAFEGCSSFSAVHINSIEDWCNISFGNYSANPLYYAKNLYLNRELVTELIIPDGVTNIGNYAFNNCTSLKKIIFEDGSETLSLGFSSYNSSGTGEGLFYDCPLDSIYLGRNLSYNNGKSYGYSPFYNKDSLIHVIIGREVTAINDYAFYGCDNIHSLTIPNGVLSIGSNAFSTPDKVIWLTNTPPTGYAYAKGSINYVANDQYASLSNTKVYPYLSSIFEVEGVKYVPVSPSDRTCHAIDCAYDSTATTINVSETTSFKGVAMKVTEVMPYTFYGNNHIKEVSVSHLGHIGDYAFYNCDSIKPVNVSNQGDIGSQAFYDCDGIENVNVANLGDIGNQAFYNCDGIKDVNISNLGNIGSQAFYNSDAIESVTISNHGDIGEKAFYDCNGIKTIDVQNRGIVGAQAFYGCNAMETAIITNRAPGVFSNNDAPLTFADWTSTNKADSSTSSETYTFTAGEGTTLSFNWSVSSESNYDKLIVILDGTTILEKSGSLSGTYSNTISKGSHTLVVKYTKDSGGSSGLDQASISNIIVSKGSATELIAGVGDEAFSGCSSLKAVTLGDSIGSLGDKAFYQCTSLQEIIIPSSVKSIGAYCFSGCSAMKGATIGDGVPNIPQYTFQNCTGLTNVMVGDGVTTINNYAFTGCSALTNVTLGRSVATINNYAFQNCSSLPEITLPQAVTKVGDYVFVGCSKLADVIIADRTTALALGSNGSSALFADCPLDSVYIGGKITYSTTSSKGYSPFYRNTSLRTVVITDREEQIYANEFYGCTNLQNVTIGNGVKSIGNYAFSGCSSLEGFSFGSNMESIGAEAFSDCTNLTSITSHAAVPPTCGTQALDDINKWECVLGVPLGNADAYYAADQWKEFFFIEDNVTDGIEDIIMNDKQIDIIYDLQGRRVLNTDNLKGIYIINGKKTIK